MMVSTATATAMGVVVPTAASVSSSAGACRSRTAAAPAYTGLRRARAASRTASARLQARVARSSGRASSSGRMVVRCDVGEEVEVEFILPHQQGLREKATVCSLANAANPAASDNAAARQRPLKVLFAAGGTGGHVYPAIAIAEAIKQQQPDVKIAFAGTKDRMEWSVVPSAGYEIFPIPAVSLQRKRGLLLSNLLLPFKLLYAIFKCWQLIGRIKPNAVIGTGGYVSLPTCAAAVLRGCPVILQEQNAFAGVANRLLGLFATVIFVAFEQAKSAFPVQKCVLAGNPTRAALCAATRQASLKHFSAMASGSNTGSMPDNAEVVSIIGGSLGADALNKAARLAMPFLLQSRPLLHVVWQTGKIYYDEVKAIATPHPRLLIVPYHKQVEYAYAAADLVVARAGAITCSELLVTGTPSVLIPSSNVTEDHQTKNAQAMVSAGAAVLLAEEDLTPDDLSAKVTSLLDDPVRLSEMKKGARAAARPQAADEMASTVVSIAVQHQTRRGWIPTFAAVA
eukprot:jgi/Chlat1/2177/Chrsp17S02752